MVMPSWSRVRISSLGAGEECYSCVRCEVQGGQRGEEHGAWRLSTHREAPTPPTRCSGHMFSGSVALRGESGQWLERTMCLVPRSLESLDEVRRRAARVSVAGCSPLGCCAVVFLTVWWNCDNLSVGSSKGPAAQTDAGQPVLAGRGMLHIP
ncbi:hypothetical protein E2C01_028993 [Portunus trituberculatus]|uniref:Uncharacterized protein n=1 Tax=Portunus trituberculatus TaxID=210409 RepID=A0A5B7EQL7_PORTR|nr:hypothetical protein [Portunus trituberculatus]